MQTLQVLDRIDLKILSALQAEARISNQKLADKVALSASSCLQRVKKLEKSGLLKSYHAYLDIEKIQRHVSCIATVRLLNHSQKHILQFENLIAAIDEIVECFTVSGQFDFFLRIICPDMSHYLAINDHLISSCQQGIAINTHVIMKTNKVFRGIKLDTILPQ